VRTLHAAADLLRNADSIDGLTPLAAVAGIAGDPSPLDAATLRALGIDEQIVTARVAAGVGALRALMLVAEPHASLRSLLPRIAARLATRAPHVLWLVIATQPAHREVAIAAWSGDRRPPRVSALVANRAALVDSDAETLRALSTAASNRDIVTHARWVEVLGREALTVRFYRALERSIDAMSASSTVGSSADRREIALLDASRLLFLSFLEAKGWLDGDAAFLAHAFDRCMESGGRFHGRVLRPLFFGTLNTPIAKRSPTATRFGRIPFLNGGLFARTPLERRHRQLAFSDEAYGLLVADVFGQYRFTAREESSSWAEAAVDPEMLGRAFESLMASTERRRTGAFFTPFSLVERVADAGLAAVLDGHSAETLRRLTELDPASGSGAFLVHALERMAHSLAVFGDGRSLSVIRRDVLTRAIFGVDINPTAVWLCELRLWLSVVIESTETNPAAVLPLPNLDRNIRVGDALSGRAFGDDGAHAAGGPAVCGLRRRYANASGPRKTALGRELDRVERIRALRSLDAEILSTAQRRRDLVVARRGRDLFGERYRPSRDERVHADALRATSASLRTQRRRLAAGGALPFSFPVHFADVASHGGFGLIVGNPPWVRLHGVPAKQRGTFRQEYDVARRAAWEAGAGPAAAGAGFAAQVDVAALFVERSIRLLAPHGALALLLPVKLWQSLAGGGVRRLIGDATDLLALEDHSEARPAFDAAVYPSLIAARRKVGNDDGSPVCTQVAIHLRGEAPFTWRAPLENLALDASSGAPWIMLPPDARRAFERLRAAGTPLAQSPVGRPYLGVKCGCNDAFVVELLDVDDDLAQVLGADGTRVTIERALLRPLLRGEHLRRWRIPEARDHIIWTHGDDGAPLPSLPKYAARWLARWRRTLDARTDARHRGRWWSLFRTESARNDRVRVVWGDVGREPRASVLDGGSAAVPLNSCYVARCRDVDDANVLATLLNGPLARAWLSAIAEPARGGYHRYLGWTLSLLPVPADWERARAVLAPLGERGRRGEPLTERELFDASVAAYRLTRDEVAPLVAWQSR
jgi:hypothetical protein